MNVEELKSELESITSKLTSTGFNKIETELVEKLEKLAAAADELGMKEGKHLIRNLLSFIKSFQDGKPKIEDSGNLRLTALDFYLKRISGGDRIEELQQEI